MHVNSKEGEPHQDKNKQKMGKLGRGSACRHGHAPSNPVAALRKLGQSVPPLPLWHHFDDQASPPRRPGSGRYCRKVSLSIRIEPPLTWQRSLKVSLITFISHSSTANARGDGHGGATRIQGTKTDNSRHKLHVTIEIR